VDRLGRMNTIKINIGLNNERNLYIKNIIEKRLDKDYFIINGGIKREFKRAI